MSKPIGIIEFLLSTACNEEACFRIDDLKILAPNELNYLLDKKILRPTGKLSDHVLEDNENKMVCTIPGTQSQGYFFFDEAGEPVNISKDRITLYAIDYGKIAQMISENITSQKYVKELLPKKLWICGQYGSQLREVYFTLNAGSDANIRAFLSTQYKRGVIIQIGKPDQLLAEEFHESHVCLIQDVLSWSEGELKLTGIVVNARIEDLPDGNKRKKVRTGKKYKKYMEIMINALIDAFKFYLKNARRVIDGGSSISIPPTHKRTRRLKRRIEDFDDQHSLAESTGIPESTVSNIIHEWREYSSEECNRTCLALMEFLTSDKKYFADEVIKFYNEWRSRLHDIGFRESR
jgi:hypothetical protein